MKAIELQGIYANTNFGYEMQGPTTKPSQALFTPISVYPNERSAGNDIVTLPLKKGPSPTISTTAYAPLIIASSPRSEYGTPILVELQPDLRISPLMTSTKIASADFNRRVVHHQKPKKLASPIGAKRAKKMEAFNRLKSRLMENVPKHTQSFPSLISLPALATYDLALNSMEMEELFHMELLNDMVTEPLSCMNGRDSPADDILDNSFNFLLSSNVFDNL